jgi:collagen type III alpha
VPVATPEFAAQRAALAERLAASYMPIDLCRPGVRVLSWEPPVVVVEGFLSDDECEALTDGAQQSGAGGRRRRDACRANGGGGGRASRVPFVGRGAVQFSLGDSGCGWDG